MQKADDVIQCEHESHSRGKTERKSKETKSDNEVNTWLDVGLTVTEQFSTHL